MVGSKSFILPFSAASALLATRIASPPKTPANTLLVFIFVLFFPNHVGKAVCGGPTNYPFENDLRLFTKGLKCLRGLNTKSPGCKAANSLPGDWPPGRQAKVDSPRTPDCLTLR